MKTQDLPAAARFVFEGGSFHARAHSLAACTHSGLISTLVTLQPAIAARTKRCVAGPPRSRTFIPPPESPSTLYSQTYSQRRNALNGRQGAVSGSPVELMGNPAVVPGKSSARKFRTSLSSANSLGRADRRAWLKTRFTASSADGRSRSSSESHASSYAHPGKFQDMFPVSQALDSGCDRVEPIPGTLTVHRLTALPVPLHRLGQAFRQRGRRGKTENLFRP